MLKSDILKKLGEKHHNLSESDVEQVFNIFVKKITSALKNDKNVEIINNNRNKRIADWTLSLKRKTKTINIPIENIIFLLLTKKYDKYTNNNKNRAVLSVVKKIIDPIKAKII